MLQYTDDLMPACLMETDTLMLQVLEVVPVFLDFASSVHQRESSNPEEERDEASVAAGLRIRFWAGRGVPDPR